MKILKSAESVMSGHPDKICDQISDSVLDEILKLDPSARVAVNASIKNYTVFLFGEITTTAIINYDFFNSIVYNVLRGNSVVKEDEEYKYKLILEISKQSPNIAQGVDTGGAGDQGSVYGYATNETDEYLPLPVVLAHKILKDLTIRSIHDNLGPDGKCQVIIDYSNTTPKIDSIVLSVQHREDDNIEDVRDFVKISIDASLNDYNNYMLGEKLDTSNYELYINNTGLFTIGGSFGDSGLTGRKIVVDTYGPSQPHGGGAFSGKDPSKLDRSGAYAARWLAKNIVAAGLADECGIEISYAIGKAEPVAVAVTGKNFSVGIEKLENFIIENFPLTPAWIIDSLKLKRPIYRQTATFGHFGRNGLSFPWEKLDLVNKFKNCL